MLKLTNLIIFNKVAKRNRMSLKFSFFCQTQTKKRKVKQLRLNWEKPSNYNHNQRHQIPRPTAINEYDLINKINQPSPSAMSSSSEQMLSTFTNISVTEIHYLTSEQRLPQFRDFMLNWKKIYHQHIDLKTVQSLEWLFSSLFAWFFQLTHETHWNI